MQFLGRKSLTPLLSPPEPIEKTAQLWSHVRMTFGSRLDITPRRDDMQVWIITC